jgi:hypothetical protein
MLKVHVEHGPGRVEAASGGGVDAWGDGLEAWAFLLAALCRTPDLFLRASAPPPSAPGPDPRHPAAAAVAGAAAGPDPAAAAGGEDEDADAGAADAWHARRMARWLEDKAESLPQDAALSGGKEDVKAETKGGVNGEAEGGGGRGADATATRDVDVLLGGRGRAEDGDMRALLLECLACLVAFVSGPPASDDDDHHHHHHASVSHHAPPARAPPGLAEGTGEVGRPAAAQSEGGDGAVAGSSVWAEAGMGRAVMGRLRRRWLGDAAPGRG